MTEDKKHQLDSLVISDILSYVVTRVFDMEESIRRKEKLLNCKSLTDGELEKEALAIYKVGSYPQVHPDFWTFIHGYIAGAKPREKYIAELKETNKRLLESSASATMMYEDLCKAKGIIQTLIESLEVSEGKEY